MATAEFQREARAGTGAGVKAKDKRLRRKWRLGRQRATKKYDAFLDACAYPFDEVAHNAAHDLYCEEYRRHQRAVNVFDVDYMCFEVERYRKNAEK